MKITVVGTGYVGLVTGTCLAETGNEVVCIDIDKRKVEQMQNGEIPIYEPHLDVIFERNIKADRLRFSTSLAEGISHGDIIFLALPTPEDEDGSADLSYVLDTAKNIGKLIKEYKVIVDKSTVPVGTADQVRTIISNETNVEFDVVSNPEFLREGFAVDDFLKPERIVIGSSSKRASALMQKLYKPFVRSGNPIIVMDERSAELTKYAANSFLATKITFMNEIANFCEKVGADVDKVRVGMGTDSRIGKRFLFPGIGYGGSCFPKDVKALYKSGLDNAYSFQILKSVLDVNNQQRTILVPKMKDYFNGQLQGKTFGVWGLAFKPETDDIREAPALYIIDELLNEKAKVKVYDPEAMSNVKNKYKDQLEYTSNMYNAIKEVDALIICTEWSIFRTPDFNKVKSRMKTPVIFDGRNLYDVNDMEKEGFTYISIGRDKTTI
ncbi:UDP-glucose/GDP-mannose dehydrogenase family protein [Psychroserpens sp.]|uniref:UDP-glucose dehydrogenase family protein n=1 Tax=Psychroserpens sp. TaxID=2020870 RepID=UPI001B1AEB85|nr:UDP-glucose/GDP-mannose dehydrogenase family protein [Psychroserpens sp.]MBO6605402.1 UDP-glucose/GDP-mannose dehydrogenase family protein [Psychroserpens sp.]MBO6630178.1 UDP-glucose/GDP-mannose dehydrogenase family protein [Psychroserpens sp.]MBO6653789.1 UDP-glucose/GDP-mannose dehydrogenase family protein [Psychroserpens sp.]MBO6682110.1 UDP-glucose/GDP-mannose dehydrogenase family protein [Psychroserpens sp.]MBO6748776.1 UDP-glucose/GDP-mannose dehydrogenase family protein [Psychroserp